MPKLLHVIYIPGIGDSNPVWQVRAVNSWRRYCVNSELVHMNWADKKPWNEKFARILLAIDEAVSEGCDVGLVGASAGASAAINAFAVRKDKVVGVVLIAGKINRPQTIGLNYRKNAPAFLTSANECQKALSKLTSEDRRRILSRYGFIDELVNKSDSKVDGAQNRHVFGFEHRLTIGTQLIFGAPGFIRFLKKQI